MNEVCAVGLCSPAGPPVSAHTLRGTWCDTAQPLRPLRGAGLAVLWFRLPLASSSSWLVPVASRPLAPPGTTPPGVAPEDLAPLARCLSPLGTSALKTRHRRRRSATQPRQLATLPVSPSSGAATPLAWEAVGRGLHAEREGEGMAAPPRRDPDQGRPPGTAAEGTAAPDKPRPAEGTAAPDKPRPA
jgi:hypothetical protein